MARIEASLAVAGAQWEGGGGGGGDIGRKVRRMKGNLNHLKLLKVIFNVAQILSNTYRASHMYQENDNIWHLVIPQRKLND